VVLVHPAQILTLECHTSNESLFRWRGARRSRKPGVTPNHAPGRFFVGRAGLCRPFAWRT